MPAASVACPLLRLVAGGVAPERLSTAVMVHSSPTQVPRTLLRGSARGEQGQRPHVIQAMA